MEGGRSSIFHSPFSIFHRDRPRLEAVFRHHQPHIVFHAAAHKHVPIMECNVEEAVSNNVLGTKYLIEVAESADVERFVLISTDKAVNPTSVMGATKRICEMMIANAMRPEGESWRQGDKETRRKSPPLLIPPSPPLLVPLSVCGRAFRQRARQSGQCGADLP